VNTDSQHKNPKKAFLIRYPKDSSVSNFAVKKKKKKKLGKEKMKAERINNEKLQKMLNDLNLSSYTRPSHSSYRVLIQDNGPAITSILEEY
jgi:SMC interacting uncharacterized protein involved in chromosome segregation